MGLPKVFLKDTVTPVEMLDVETLKSRIGEPLPPKRPAAEDEAAYRRSDGRRPEERSWRKIAGLSR